MLANLLQLGLAVFGLTALHLSMGTSERGRYLAPFIGLAGQPLWLLFAWWHGAWGLFLLSLAYTAVYLRGARLRWRDRKVKR